MCVFSQGRKNSFFLLIPNWHGMGLPSKSHSLRSRRKTREFSCNKGIWARDKTGHTQEPNLWVMGSWHTRVSLARPFFLRPFFLSLCAAFFLACDRRAMAVAGQFFLVPANEMGWPNLHGYFPVPPFLFTTGNPCWIPVVDWHSAIKRVTSLNSTEIKGMSLLRSSH